MRRRGVGMACFVLLVFLGSAASASAGQRWLYIKMTQQQGWQYKVDIPFPTPHIHAYRSISSSPPGQAKLGIVFSQAPVPGTMYFGTANAGRPNGPKLEVSPGYFAYNLPKVGRVAPFGITAGPCGEVAEDVGPGYEPFMNEEACPDPSGVATGGLSDDEPDNFVKAMVKDLNNRPKWAYVLNFDTYEHSRGCNFFVYPNGQWVKSNDWTKGNGCGEKSLKVVGIYGNAN